MMEQERYLIAFVALKRVICLALTIWHNHDSRNPHQSPHRPLSRDDRLRVTCSEVKHCAPNVLTLFAYMLSKKSPLRSVDPNEVHVGGIYSRILEELV